MSKPLKYKAVDLLHPDLKTKRKLIKLDKELAKRSELSERNSKVDWKAIKDFQFDI